MAHDVFISYSSKDKVVADAVCAKLEAQKIRAWIAPRDVPPGANFGQSIIRAINTCKVFVLIWSANTNSSEHILNEINQAFDRGLTIIPFRIQDVQPTDEMRYYFGRTHWLDAIDPPLENHIAALRDTVKINLDTQVKVEAPTETPAKPEDPAPQKIEKVAPESTVKKGKPEHPGAGLSLGKFGRWLPFVAGGLLLVALVVILASGGFTGWLSKLTAQSSAAPLFASVPTTTPRPTATPKSTPTITPMPAWIEDFAGPILAAIESQEPDLSADFSEENSEWVFELYGKVHTGERCANTTGVGLSITGGSLQASVDAYCPQIILTSYRFRPFTNSVRQIDINLANTQGIVSIEYFSSMTITANFDANGGFGFGIDEQGRQLEYSYLSDVFDASGPFTVTIINSGPYYLVYIDDVLVFSKDNLDGSNAPEDWDLNLVREGAGFDVETFELDNLNVWDLDQLER
jgi:hypothetical protein